MPKLPGPEDPPLFPPPPDPRAEHRRRVGERLVELAARDGASFVSTRLARLARRFTEGLHEARAGDVAPAGRLDAQLRADLDAAAEGAPSPEAEEALRRRGEILLAGAFQKATIAQEFALQSEQRSGLAQALADLGEAAHLAPHDYASLAEQLSQTVDGAALLLRPETLKALKEAEPKRLAEAAREGLKSGAFDLGGARVALPLGREQVKGLTRLARAAERDAEARNRQEEASLRAEAAAGVGRRALDLELAVGRGEAGLTEIEEAAQSGVIGAKKRAALEAAVAARQTEAEAEAGRAELLAAALGGDGKALDPKDPEHRQAVEEGFAAILSESADLEPEAFAAQAAHFAGATGIVPERLVTRVSAGLRSEDPQVQANAARLLKAMTDAAPDDLSADGTDFMPAQVARADALVRYLDAGIAAPEAVRLADEDIGAKDSVVRRDLALRPGDLVDKTIKPLGPAKPGDHLVGAQPLAQPEADTAEDGAGKDSDQGSEPGGPEGPRPKKPEKPKPDEPDKPDKPQEPKEPEEPDWDPMIDRLLEREGGFNEADPSNRGIKDDTLEDYRARTGRPFQDDEEKMEALRNLTKEEAREIYRDIIDRYNLADIKDEGLAEQVFDGVVNHGTRHAIEQLQEELNEVFGLKEGEEGWLNTDGHIGPKTRRTLQRAIDEGRVPELRNRLVDRRKEFIDQIPDGGLAETKEQATQIREALQKRAEKFRP